MPHIPVHPSARKRHRQNLKRRERNQSLKAEVRTAVKQAALAIAGADAAAAQEKMREATSALARARSAGTMHRNTVRRKIARLASRLNKNQAKAQS
jgi:small subunit ribosomal protein S20